MDSDQDIQVLESNDKRPRIKTPPKASAISVPFQYAASSDGTDENLLILLHGLGDRHVPFYKLGRQLNLPQTAVLALRAPEQVPFLYEESFQWYPSFSPLGELIENPNPTPALELLSKLVNHLVDECAWPPHRIHLFGFAQGGSVVSEFGIRWWRDRLQAGNKAALTSLGSIVTVSGPLLSYPTLSKKNPTPLLIFHRSPPAESALSPDAVQAFRHGYESVVDIKLAGGADGMPRSKDEWQSIMEFWSHRLGRRQAEDMYEVFT